VAVDGSGKLLLWLVAPATEWPVSDPTKLNEVLVPPSEPPPPRLVASLAYAGAAPPGSPKLHFLQCPVNRSVADPLTWRPCALLWWREREDTLQQIVLPAKISASASKLAEGDELDLSGGVLSWRLPHPVCASVVGAATTLCITGHTDGSLIVWDTNVRADKYVLQQHKAPISSLALYKASLLVSLAEDCTLHCYDLSPEPETGQGKLVFRRSLPLGIHFSWVAWASRYPLVFLASPGVIRVLDANGDILSLLQPSPGLTLHLGSPDVCGPTSLDHLLAVSSADATATGDATAEAEPAAEPDALCSLSLDQLLNTLYPHISELFGSEPTAAAYREALVRFSHAQRLDRELMGSLSFLAGPKGMSRRGQGSTTSRGSVKGRKGRSSSIKPTPDGSSGGSRANSVAGSTRAAADKGARGTMASVSANPNQLSEAMLRSCGAGSEADARSTACGSAAITTSQQPSASRGDCDWRSLGSAAGNSMASSVMSAGGESKAGATYVDQTAKVQRLQRSRLHGRFTREARVQRRWEELKTTASQMAQRV